MAHHHSTTQNDASDVRAQWTARIIALIAGIAIAITAACAIAGFYSNSGPWRQSHIAANTDTRPINVNKNAVPQPTIIIRQSTPTPNQAIIDKREADARAAEEAARQQAAAEQAAAEAARQQAAEEAAAEAARQQAAAEEAARKEQEKAAAAEAQQNASQAAWMNPTGTQPNLADYTNLSIRVSLAEQQVHIMSNGQDIYVMRASTGLNDATPRGQYVINGLRGDSFYNPSEGMGARYWVGFIGGVYLFHSVPTDVNGNWIASEGDKLGQPASHGCVRLSVADAAWFYQQIPNGTPIDIG